MTDAQIEAITPDLGLQKALRGGCHTAIVSPEGNLLAPPLTEGVGMVVADLDMTLVTKRKRMMDSVGHCARPELLSLAINDRPAVTVRSMNAASSSSHATESRTDEHHRDDALQPATDDRAAVVRLAAG